METTIQQQTRLARYFYRNIELAAFKLSYGETELKLNIMKSQLLDDVGPAKSIDDWCKYWAEWQKQVVEKWHANYQCTEGLTPLEIKVLQVATKVTEMLDVPFTKKHLIYSPLMKFLQEKEDYILHLQEYYHSIGFVNDVVVLETDDRREDEFQILEQRTDVDPYGHVITNDCNYITVSKYTGEEAYVEWRVNSNM